MTRVKIGIGDACHIINLDLVMELQEYNVSKKEDDYPYKIKFIGASGTVLNNVGWKKEAERDECFNRLEKILKPIDLDADEFIDPIEQFIDDPKQKQNEDILTSSYDPMEAIK